MPAEVNDQKPIKGVGFPQIIHDRARSAGEELHKLLISLSTAIFSVHFLSITSAKTIFTVPEKAALITAMSSMGIAVFSGIIGWFADCRRNYFWAIAMQETEKAQKSINYKQRDKWLEIEKINAWILGFSFALGIIASLVYIIIFILK